MYAEYIVLYKSIKYLLFVKKLAIELSFFFHTQFLDFTNLVLSVIGTFYRIENYQNNSHHILTQNCAQIIHIFFSSISANCCKSSKTCFHIHIAINLNIIRSFNVPSTGWLFTNSPKCFITVENAIFGSVFNQLLQFMSISGDFFWCQR